MASKTCRGSYIAGCNRDYKGVCCESMEDHIESMLKKYRSLDERVKSSIRKAYEIYIKAIKDAFPVNKSIEESPLIRCDPVEIVIAFHDLGKCTERNQESLGERCTAPYHEIISAASLYALSISIDRSLGSILVLPHLIAILLHHHSMRSIRRSIRDIADAAHRSKLYQDSDSGNVAECAKISLKMSCPDLAPYIANPEWISNISKYISELPKIVGVIEKLRGRGRNNLYYLIYRVAVMITGVISVLDRYAASVNRSCGKASEGDLDRDVIEYFRRRKAFIEASRALSIGGS